MRVGPTYLDFNIGCLWGTCTLRGKNKNDIIKSYSFILNRFDLQKQIYFHINHMRKVYWRYGFQFTETTKYWYDLNLTDEKYTPF